MKVFLSSTFLDLLEDREAVLEALHKKQVSTLAMEYFVASPKNFEPVAVVMNSSVSTESSLPSQRLVDVTMLRGTGIIG